MLRILKVPVLVLILLSTVYTQQYYSWSSLGNGANGTVYSITSYQNKIIIAGSFTIAGGEDMHDIASWDGNNWSPLDEGFNGNNPAVYALTIFNSNLVAAGRFQHAGGNDAQNIASWNGNFWFGFANGLGSNNEKICALTVNNGILTAGGSFNFSGG